MKSIKKILGVFVFLYLAIMLLPNSAFAQTIDDAKSIRKLTVKSVPPTKMEDAYQIGEIISEMFEGYGLDVVTCNSNYTKCDMFKFEDFSTFEVNITYEYDKDVKKVVDSIMAKLPNDGKDFTLTDIEYINYILNVSENEEVSELNISNYSSELKKFIDYKNFTIEPRMGDDGAFFTYKAGTATFIYDGTVYAFVDKIGVIAKQVVYIDDTKDIAKSIKTRLSKFFDIKDVVATGYTIEEVLEDARGEFADIYDQNEQWLKEEFGDKNTYINSMMDEYYNNIDAPMHFLLDAENELYEIEFSNDLKIQIAVLEDESKINDDVEIITNDVNSDVTISTKSKSIPLDTLIQVAKITSGEEYEKIVKLLNVTNSEMFDLKLFSKSNDKYITKLDDGTFEVKLPIVDSLKDKNLIVYYVDSEDNIEEYEVTIKDGYAVFETDHFSIYTLAEKIEDSTTISNSNTYTETIKNPQTVDNVMLYISMLCLSLIGVVGLYKKNKIS